MQRMQRMRFHFTVPASRAHVADWLAVAGAGAPAPASVPVDQAAGQWLAHVLLFMRCMLQAARLPVFEEPGIESIAQVGGDPSRLVAAVRFPVIERITPAVYELALRASSALLHRFAGLPVDRESRRQFFEAIENEIHARIRPAIPGGKGTVPVLRAAHAMGVPILHLGEGIYQLGWGSASRRLARSVTQGDSALGARMAQSKWDTSRLLALAGLPAPLNGVARTVDETQAIAKQLGWPVVVKPTDRERGEGVTVDVTGDTALAAAFEHARAASQRGEVIVERQAEGICHRLFISHGRLLYAVKRMSMSVKGDGLRTVAQLVAEEVERDACLPPWQRSGIAPLDEMAMACLRRHGLEATSVPPSGAWVPLRRIESTAWGGVDEDVSRSVHPDNLDASLRAASLLGLEVAGVDIITQDIAKPWHETGAIINEVNLSPLLGGGDISRSHLPEFIRRLMGDAMGRIPLEAFASDAHEDARMRWRSWLGEGLRAWYVDGVQALGPDGVTRHLSSRGIDQRIRAVLLDAQVDALVAVMTPSEFRATHLPLGTLAGDAGAAAVSRRAPAPAA